MVRIKFVDFWPHISYSESAYSNNIYGLITSTGLFTYDTNIPQILVYSCFGNEHMQAQYNNCIKIFISCEVIPERLYTANYYIGCDPTNKDKNYLYFPVWRMYDIAVKFAKNRPIVQERQKFCSFTVSNETAQFRKELFFKLAKYKKIDSGGLVLNNMPNKYPVKDKYVFDSAHKFSLCCENYIKSGYTTEKIVQAYLAGCIPIYVGDPDCEFNKKAYITGINADEIVEKVKEVDNNDILYKAMLNEPLGVYENDDLKNFLIKIIKENDLWKNSSEDGAIIL